MEIIEHQQKLRTLVEGYLRLAKEMPLPLIKNKVQYKFEGSRDESLIVLSVMWSATWESQVSKMPSSEPWCFGVHRDCMWPEGYNSWKIRSRNPHHPEWKEFNALVDALQKQEAAGHNPFIPDTDEESRDVHWYILEKPSEQKHFSYLTTVNYYGHKYQLAFRDLPGVLKEEKENIKYREGIISEIWQRLEKAKITCRDAKISDFLSEGFVQDLEARMKAVLSAKDILPAAGFETLEQDRLVYRSHLEECLGLTALKSEYQSSEGKVESYF